MSGTILVAEKAGLATSTSDFDYLAEKIRAAFLPEHESIKSAVFEPLDEGGMTFISAADLESKEFQAFARAVKDASVTAMVEPIAEPRRDYWMELCKLLEKDSRSEVASG